MPYTLIEHSGLPGCVELVSIRAGAQLNKVRAAGGLIMNTYDEAAAKEYAVNYPQEGDRGGIVPHGQPIFSKKRIGAQRIYAPPKVPA